jgi:hypothetical protein
MNKVYQWLACCVAISCLWFAMTGVPGTELPATVEAADAVQDPTTLDRRISMLEQKFFIVESSMRRLEQQVTQRPTPLGDQQRTDTAILRAEIERLKAHIQTIECGVAKLDERTLPPKLRQSGDSAYKDPCRLNPETPLRLPSRP